MSGIDRTQNLRIDCTKCKGRGYEETSTGQVMCDRCDGAGVLEKEVPYKFETRGVWTKEEMAEAFEMPVEDVRDDGHDVPKTNGVPENE